jgi:alanyl-tRNA synthetase
MEGAVKINDFNILVSEVESESLDELKGFGDKILNVLGSGVGILGSDNGDKSSVVIVVTDDIIKRGINAGDLAKIIGKEMGGGGGGKPSLATAGGKDSKSYAMAMKKSIDLIKSELKKVED